jgi:hypothetical protein
MVDLGWSLWAELGVPGVLRNHKMVAVDLEPLIVMSPSLFSLEPRLRDQVYGWCVSHRTRVSVSRLRGLLSALTPAARESYSEFAASLLEFDNVRWPGAGEPRWHERPAVGPVRLPILRPSLVRLRARRICGVGVRADVICELVGREPEWTRASELAANLGYTARQTRQVLGEMQEAGSVRACEEGHGRVFRLENPTAWRRILAAEGLIFPRWSHITRMMLLALELHEQRKKSRQVLRVKANNLRPELDRIAGRLRLRSPPTTVGEPDAYGSLTAWLQHQLGDLANGSSRALE